MAIICDRGVAMAYATGYRYDVFVSYARKDDEDGWVSHLLHRLSSEISRRLGRAGNELHFFRDSETLEANASLDGLTQAVARSALFLAIGSPSYADSEWCRKELHKAAETDPEGQRRYIAEMLVLRGGQRYDARIAEKNRIEFWMRDKYFSERPKVLARDDRDYDLRIQKLAGDIVEELDAARGRNAQQVAAAGIPAHAGNGARAPRGVVFLADATDDLVGEPEEMRTYLEQYGWEVRPHGELPPLKDLHRAIEAELAAKPKLFVQLLSALPGRRSPEVPEGKVRAQYDMALKAGLPMMLWRSEELDLEAVRRRDPEHHRLLTDERVAATTLESFKDAVRQALDRPAVVDEGETETDILLVNSDAPDLAAAQQLQLELSAHDKMSVLVDLAGSAGHKRDFIETAFKTSKCVVVLHGRGTDTWVLAQFRHYLKLSVGRIDLQNKPVALVLGPPGPPDPGIRLKNLEIIRSEDAWRVEPILDFVASHS